MTRNQIIEKLFTGKNFTDCINKMEPEHLREDLKMEVITIVCEWPDEKVIKLHQDNVLEFYVARVILTQVKGNRTPFGKQYRQRVEQLTTNEIADEVDTEAREMKELIEDLAIEEIELMKDSKEHWYAYELIQLYVKHGNFRAIEKETRIPFISCYKTIKKTAADIRAKVEYIKANPLKKKIV